MHAAEEEEEEADIGKQKVLFCMEF